MLKYLNTTAPFNKPLTIPLYKVYKCNVQQWSADGGQGESEVLAMIHRTGVIWLTGFFSGPLWDWTRIYRVYS
jgi:hypothetical protein